MGNRNGPWLALAAASLGIIAAIALIGSVRVGAGNRKFVALESRNALRNAQLRAIAASQTRGAKARFTKLEVKDVMGSSGYHAVVNETLAEPMPEDVAFECGGKDAGETCFGAAQSCISSAESLVANLYAVDPISATQTQANSVCKCFESNGCRPSCNVALYTQWATRSGINCPAHPPTFDEETGVYQYGDPNAVYLAPTDLSFDFYPNYPNPAGHQYTLPWARNVYEDEPGIGFYQAPLLATYKPGVEVHPISSGMEDPFGTPDAPSRSVDAVYCGDDSGFGC